MNNVNPTGAELAASHPPPPRYARQWAVTLLLAGTVGAFGGWSYLHPPADPPPLPSPADHPYVDWFQMVVLPELNSDPAVAARLLGRMEEWLHALRREGFVLLPFTQVLSNLERGEGVPERTLVVVFEPGYRITYEGVAPLLEKLDVPALWVTQDPGLHLTDRRFVTRHERWRMGRSGRWDVGIRAEDKEGFRLSGSGVVSVEPRTFAWAAHAGRYGINRLEPSGVLTRLHANRRLTSRELIDRLLAEHPIEEAAPLTAREILGRPWGTLPCRGDERPAAFDLHVGAQRRAASVSWQGAAGLNDMELQINVREVYGEFWVLLRSDPAARRRICVAFTPDRLLVDEQEGPHHHTRLAEAPSPLVPGGPLEGSIRLAGDRLRISCPGQEDVIVEGIGLDAKANAILELNVRDRIRGAARATGIELLLVPLHESVLASLPED